ncbi:Hypothetical protein PENO1_009050 [Penicillium occitanis (nom. inval.)]|nr:Hypothetical protein PENO1_009050 [Penicillium occitanis (nom. inval.)]PCH10044.1 hypothetical protein PENOC_005690 [Penicillium occitanis (nom. inval.)]
MPPYAITPFKDLCLTLQPLNPHLRPMPAVCITALPLKDKRDPIWADPCCLQCAKLVGSVDLYCVPHPNKNEHKCIRCFNLNITCVPIPEEQIETFRSIQIFFKKRDLNARFGRQFFLLNRNIERLINTQLAIRNEPPVAPIEEVFGDDMSRYGACEDVAPCTIERYAFGCLNLTYLGINLESNILFDRPSDRAETMAANHFLSSKELCLTQQQSDLQLETMFTARIIDLFCVPFLDKGVYKCIRCFNLRIKCTALPRDCVDDFIYVQQRFQYSGLERAFEARNARIDRMSLESPSLGIEQQLSSIRQSIDRLSCNMERLINYQLSNGGEQYMGQNIFRRHTAAEGMGMDEQRRRKLQERKAKERLQILELKNLIQQGTADYEKQKNKILRSKIGVRLRQLKHDLELKEVSLEEITLILLVLLSTISISFRFGCLIGLPLHQVDLSYLKFLNLNIMSYHLSSFGQLCFIQQSSPLHSQPVPAVRITALPPKDPRNPIWAADCCMNCAKLVGSADLFCVPCPAKGKCVRCFNLNLPCEPLREDNGRFFREIQQYFQFYDLQTAFEARKAWFDRMDGPTTDQSPTWEEGCEPPVDADGTADSQSKGATTEKALKQFSEIQMQQKRKAAIESLIAEETAKYEMETDLVLKDRFGRRVEQLERHLAVVKSSIEKLEAGVDV